MACKRSAVRSRLAPPAFARFASFGWASHTLAYRGDAALAVAFEKYLKSGSGRAFAKKHF
jgi:hypothetical protein